MLIQLTYVIQGRLKCLVNEMRQVDIKDHLNTEHTTEPTGNTEGALIQERAED